VTDTSSITLTSAANSKNSIQVLSTPVGVPTTINLLSATDTVFVGVSPQSFPDRTTPLQGTTTPGTGASVQYINGTVNIIHPHSLLTNKTSVLVDDSGDTGVRRVTIGNNNIAGLAPTVITTSGVNAIGVYGSKGSGSTYQFSGTLGQTTFY